MNNRVTRPLFHSAFCILHSAFLAGCIPNFGTGGTGERIVPRETTHTIESFDISASATTQASTEPSTRPSATLHSTTVPLSIEEARRLALQNNLEISVSL